MAYRRLIGDGTAFTEEPARSPTNLFDANILSISLNNDRSIAASMSMPEPEATFSAASVLRCREAQCQTAPDWLAREEPLEIRVRGESVAVTMRTPGHDRELAAGFLYSEGLVSRRGEIVEIAPCTAGENAAFGNIVNVFLAPSLPFDFERLKRHTFASSSCGLCGKATIESVHQRFEPIASHFQLEAAIIPRLPEALRAAQETFTKTGGLHAAGIFDAQGQLIAMREDVGRHNAVDKVIGWAFLHERLPLDHQILFVSGRTSFEIVQKALAARFPIVAAVSAPSSLAVEFAQENGQTLIGFVRERGFNVYSHAERLHGTCAT